MSLWEKSVAAYSGALQLRSDPQTQANYDFVKQKLTDLKKKNAQQPDKNTPHNKQDKSSSGSENSQSSDNRSGSGNTASGTQNSQKTESQNGSKT